MPSEIASFFSGLAALFTWPTLWILLAGVVAGSLVAFFPGIGSLTGLVILFPFAVSFDEPVHGLALLLGAHAVMTTADSITAILFGVPGTAGAQAIVVDGFPMARQGRAAEALGASLTSAGLGGLIGAFCFVVAIPLVIPIVKTVGSPELLMLGLWGVSMVGMLSSSALVKGLAMGALGILMGTVGLDPQRGIPRYTFDTFYLLDGLPLIAISLGLFATPQVIQLLQERTLLEVDRAEVGRITYRDVGQGVRSTFRNWMLVVRSSVMGVFLGIVPGVGGSIIDWLVYGQTVQTTRGEKHFGQGDVRGVIGPDSASNSKEGGQLLPTLGFGVPGGAGWALILAAFLSLGISPGTRAFTTDIELTFTMIWIIVLANVVATSGLLALSPYFARISLLNAATLATIILSFSLLGTYVSSMSVGDVVAFLGFSLLGYGMVQQGWPRPPLLLGVVLAPILERYLFISYNTFGWSWVTRPGVIIMYGIIAVSFFVAGRRPRSRVKSS